MPISKLLLYENRVMLSGFKKLASHKIKVSCRKIKSVAEKLRSIRLYSDDMAYRRSFSERYVSNNYHMHTLYNRINCAYCSNLRRTGPAGHLLKCLKAQYPDEAPLLPEILSLEPISGEKSRDANMPWYFRKPCIYFSRLAKKKYMKNFRHPIAEITTANYEILEGLEYGVTYGQKPCYICASINYQLFRNCLEVSGFDYSGQCGNVMQNIAKTYYPNGRYQKSFRSSPK